MWVDSFPGMVLCLALAGSGAAPHWQTRGHARAEGPLERVVVLGASVSGGHGLAVDLARALDAIVAAPHEPVRGFADHLFFLAPRPRGREQLERVRAARPTLVVAVDFLFWYGYGFAASEEERLERLEAGLAELERFECPLVVGGFPDVSAAAGKILLPAQVPAPETIAALERRVRAWSAERPGVVLLPLDELVGRIQSGAGFTIGDRPWPAEPGLRLLQWDDLHPTLEGLTGLACKIGELLRERFADVRPSDLRLDPVVLLALLQGQTDEARAARRLERAERRALSHSGR